MDNIDIPKPFRAIWVNHTELVLLSDEYFVAPNGTIRLSGEKPSARSNHSARAVFDC